MYSISLLYGIITSCELLYMLSLKEHRDCLVAGFLSCPHHSGKVLFLSRPSRLRLIVVEHGTASRWWELLGSVGTHWLFLFAFCSLQTTTDTQMFCPPQTTSSETWLSKPRLCRASVSRAHCGGGTWGRRGAQCWWRQLCTFHHFPQGSPRPRRPSAGSH